MSLAARLPLAVLLLAAATSCTQVPFLVPASPTPQPWAYVDVGGRDIYYSCYGEAEPTIILEEDLDYSGTQFASSYGDIIKAIRPKARICFYDRAGLGMSDEASTPRTSQDIVDDLHAMLVKSGLPRPVVLVGVGFGAGHSILYASQHPEDVAGLVLLWPVPPELPESIVRALPSPSPDEPNVVTMTRAFWGLLENEEGLDWQASKDQIAQVTSLGDIPLVVLSPDKYDPAAEAVAPDTWPAVEKVYRELQVKLPQLSTRGRHEIASFDTADDFASALTNAIESVLDEVQQSQ